MRPHERLTAQHGALIVVDVQEKLVPLLRYRELGRTTSLFDGAPPEHLVELGQRVRPSLVDLFMALTRNPALNPKQA